MKTKILLADDERKLLILLKDFFEKEKYEVILSDNGQMALDMFYSHDDIDLVILDVMMPLLNGWEVCERIRETSDVPIIMLTAKVNEHDELHGFMNGADEYIKKPFSPSVLIARVKVLLKRTQKVLYVFEFDNLKIDFKKHETIIDSNYIRLSKLEYKLLMFFIDNIDIVLSREQILDHVWGINYIGSDRTVDTHINRLRSKLLSYGKCIETIHGFGYKFEVNK